MNKVYDYYLINETELIKNIEIIARSKSLKSIKEIKKYFEETKPFKKYVLLKVKH